MDTYLKYCNKESSSAYYIIWSIYLSYVTNYKQKGLAMRQLLRFRLSSNSLFARLMLSFIVIILLFITFYFISISLFKTSIREEIITYNTTNLEHTIKNYEDYVRGVVDSALLFSLEEPVMSLYNQMQRSENFEFSYYGAQTVVEQIKSSFMNSHFSYVDELFVFYKDASIVINKEGIYDIHTMFSKYQIQPDYDGAFWMEQFEQRQPFRVFPSRPFAQYDPSEPSRSYFPIVVHNELHPQMYFGALIDADALFEDMHHSINYSFVIVDQELQHLYNRTNTDISHLPLTEQSQGYQRLGENYYFYKKSDYTGFTYINVIPTAHVNEKLNRLNVLLLTVLHISAGVSIVSSIFFTLRFNNPIKKILSSIQQYQSVEPIKSNIEEFNLIGNNLNTLFRKQKQMDQSLKNNQSLLQTYAYVNKLKQLHTNIQEMRDLNFANKPYRFILFDFAFKPAEGMHPLDNVLRRTSFIKEFIHNEISSRYSDSLTFQIEKNQILSLVYVHDHETSIQSDLSPMVSTFELDKEYIVLTIGVSEEHHHSDDLTKAYEQVVAAARRRMLNDEVQFIAYQDTEEPSFMLTPNQEQEFRVHLLEGNESGLLQWIRRILSHMNKKGAYAWQFRDFASTLTGRINQTLQSLQLDHEALLYYHEQLEYCHTLEQYDAFFEHYVTTTAALIKQKKDEHDHITTFVMDYIEEHYAEDISLDLLADKVKISRGYLSSYFKEKTGMNFIDYLNELRINKAKQLLEDSDLKVQDIAEKVGYLNSSSFFRMFKRMTGVTPGDYRKQLINHPRK